MTDKDDLLQKGLEALEQGVDPELIIERLPQDSDGLADLVRLAAAVRQMPHPAPLLVSARARKRTLLNAAHGLLDQAAPREATRPRGFYSPNGHGPGRERRPRPALGLRLSPGLIGALAVFLVAFVALLGAGAWLLSSPRNAQAATFMDVQGQVQVAEPDGAWRSVADGDRMRAGERIRTGPASQATLVFYEGSRTTVGGNADLTLSRVDGDRGRVLQVVLTQHAGKSSHSVVPLRGAKSMFMVFTPSGAASVHGTHFSASVGPQGVSRFAVNTGQVLVSNQASQVFLQAGQALAFSAGEALEQPAYQFTLQGELTEQGDTVWAVEATTFLVTPETVITGDPQLGGTVLVEGRILAEGWVADTIETLAEGEFAGSFTGTLDSIGGPGQPWVIGGQPVLVDEDTDVAEGLAEGDPVRVSFQVQQDGSWLALQIERLEEQPQEPTPTATPDPAAAPVLVFDPATLENAVCEGGVELTGRLVNTAAEADDTAANVELGTQITQGAEYVDSLALSDAGWETIAAGDDALFGIQVTLDEASWSAAPAGTAVEVRVFVAQETNNFGAHTSFLTVAITKSCAATPTETPTETPTGEASLTPTATGTLTETPTETPTVTETPTPSETPGPVETEQPIQVGDICTGANPHPTGQNLAQAFGVPYEEIMGWFCDYNLGFGEIEKGYSWSLTYGVPVEEIFDMRLSGMGWGNIRKALENMPGESPEPEETEEPDEDGEVDDGEEGGEESAGNGDFCATGGTHPQAGNLAQEYGVSEAEIMGWYCQGYGWGDINQAYQIHLESAAPVAEIFQMHSSGMSWGEIRKALLGNPGNGNPGNGNPGNGNPGNGNPGNGNPGNGNPGNGNP